MREIKSRVISGTGNLACIFVYERINSKGRWEHRNKSDATWHPGPLDMKGAKRVWYTGLKDKNRAEIFEGDIVSYIGHYADGKPINLQVKWDDNNCFWRGMFSETQGHHLDNFHNNDFEVIGNIYENPELLTSEAA